MNVYDRPGASPSASVTDHHNSLEGEMILLFSLEIDLNTGSFTLLQGQEFVNGGVSILTQYIWTVGAGNAYPLQYSCLENPWTEEPGKLQSIGHKELDTTEVT